MEIRIIMSSESFKMGWELNKCSYLSSDSDRNHVFVVLFCCLRENAGLNITKQKCFEKHIFCEKAWPSLAKQTLYFGISTWKSCTVLKWADLLPDAVFNISVMWLWSCAVFGRSPDQDKLPWCYTMMERAVSWEYCDIKPCSRPARQ